MDNHTTFRGSSQIGEILLLGVEEIIGRPALNAVLHLSRTVPEELGQVGDGKKRMDYAEISAASLGLEKMYGPRGGRGISLRAGRAGFKYLLRQNGTAMGITDLNYRLLPVPARLKTGMEALAGLMGQIGDELVTVFEDEDRWMWRSERCPLCWGRTSRDPVCQFTVGLLQEFSTWCSSGRVYHIDEVACQAAGKVACLIQIEKKSLD